MNDLKRIIISGFLCVFFAVGFALTAHAEDIIPVAQLFASGQKAFEERRFQDAVNDFESIIEQNTNFASAYHALGLVYQQTSSDPHYPLWYFETALEIDPDFAPSYDILCRSYYQLQNFVEAEKICLQAIEKNPNLLSSQLSLAWVYLVGYSDPDKAIYFFEKVAERLKIPVVYFGMGMAYAMREDHAEVLDIITFLRGEGALEFATQLEGILRSKTVLEQMRPKGFAEAAVLRQQQQAAAAQQAARLKDSQPRVVPVPVPVPIVVRPKITGSPRVRIKGKIKPPQIKGLSGYSQPATRGGQSQKHPGGFSE